MGIETENQNIESSMRDIAKDILTKKEVDVVIGYSKGTMPLSSTPIIIDKPEDADKLIWNNLCFINRVPSMIPKQRWYNRTWLIFSRKSHSCIKRSVINDYDIVLPIHLYNASDSLAR